MKIFGVYIPSGVKKIGKPQFHFPAFSREEIVFLATLFSFLFLAAIVAWDGYIFYVSVQKTPPPDVGANPARLVTEKQIQDVISIFNAREKKFQEILGN